MKDKKIYMTEKLMWQMFILIYVIGVICMHYFMQMDIRDDLVSKEITKDFSMIEWVIYRYYNWSARFVQEGMGYYMIWHPMLWRCINIIIMIFIPVLYMYITDAKGLEKYFCIIVFLLYPIIDMKSAGWICTTNTYLWPAFFGLIVCALIKNYIDISRKTSWYKYIIFYIVLIIACDHELLAVVLLMILLYSIIAYYNKTHKFSFFLISGLIINISNIVLILFSPGNQIRKESETVIWFAEYADFSMWQKVYLGIVRIFNILVMEFDPIYVAFCILLCISVCLYSKSIFKSIASAVPLTICFVLKTMLKFYAVGDVTEINLNQLGTYIPFLLAVITLVCITISLTAIFENVKNIALPIVVLYGGLATTFAMGFSPTIYASEKRTSTFMYFSFMYILLLLLQKINAKVEWNEKNEKTGYVFMFFFYIVFYLADIAILKYC